MSVYFNYNEQFSFHLYTRLSFVTCTVHTVLFPRRNEIGNTQPKQMYVLTATSSTYNRANANTCKNVQIALAKICTWRDAQLREATAVRRKAGASYADRT